MNIWDLPDDILLCVLRWLPTRSLLHVSATNPGLDSHRHEVEMQRGGTSVVTRCQLSYVATG